MKFTLVIVIIIIDNNEKQNHIRHILKHSQDIY